MAILLPHGMTIAIRVLCSFAIYYSPLFLNSNRFPKAKIPSIIYDKTVRHCPTRYHSLCGWHGRAGRVASGCLNQVTGIPKPRMSKSILIESKTVFAPRGTATYTPKWSIVVLALACLGVLKFNGPGSKTFVGSMPFELKLPARETIAPALPPLVETKPKLLAPPKASSTDTNSIGLAPAARLLDNHRDENQ
jgi:hypothetical protein